MTFALTGARVFDGEHTVEGHAVVIDGKRIVAVPKERDLPAGIERRSVEGLLAPGFIDLQVNGGGGVLFNDERTLKGIATIGKAHRTYGTTGFLPTFITDTRDKMAEAIEATRAAIAAGIPGVLGIHLEGPFINPERRGVHDRAYIRPIEDEDIRIMASLQTGVTMVTLAPEMVPIEAIERLAAQGIVISAGHTKAEYDHVLEACRCGLRGFTHLFNAMPPLVGRDPGVVGAALDTRNTWCGLIVDGHHVDDASLRIAIAAKGADGMILVSDAMPSVGSALTSFELLGKTVYRENGRLRIEDGTLAGSDLDMASAVRNAVRRLGVSLQDGLRMASLIPARFLRLDHALGRIAVGYRANLVLLDDELTVRQTWIDGVAD